MLSPIPPAIMKRLAPVMTKTILSLLSEEPGAFSLNNAGQL